MKKRKLTTGQGEDFTAGFTLDYNNIENRSRLIAVDLSQQTDVDADSKAIQQIEFVRKLKKNQITMVMLQTQVMTKYICFNHFRKNQRKKTKIFST